MGKKKSVVLMTLLTIVIVALCALVAFPSFPIPGTPNSWNPVALQYDLDADLGGGYYVYYYPEGVIPSSEYDEQMAPKQEKLADLEAAKQGEADAAKLAELEAEIEEVKADIQELEDSYVPHKSLYLSTDSKLAIVDAGLPSEDFVNNFEEVVKSIANRLAQKEYSTMRYAVVDDFALRIELPKSENNVSGVMSALLLTGDMSLMVGDEVVDELKEDGVEVTDLIKSISVGTRYKVSYLKVKFTTKGVEMIKRLKDSLASTPLDIKIGEETIAQITQDAITPNNREARIFAVDQANKAYLETFQILLADVLENGGHELSFAELTTTDLRTYGPVYGKNVMTLLFIALALVLVALVVLPIVFMGRYGVVGAYTTLSYFVVTAICFAFISAGSFEVSLATVLIFLAGLVLVNVFHAHVFAAIKKEFSLGKTVESSVKLGFKKTMGNIIDVYAVLLLGALALLIGVGGVHTLALQAIICIVTGAFCNLLWMRAINFTLLSASNDKYKYFRFVREDDDDE